MENGAAWQLPWARPGLWREAVRREPSGHTPEGLRPAAFPNSTGGLARWRFLVFERTGCWLTIRRNAG
jgi:hypothetical protein